MDYCGWFDGRGGVHGGHQGGEEAGKEQVGGSGGLVEANQLRIGDPGRWEEGEDAFLRGTVGGKTHWTGQCGRGSELDIVWKSRTILRVSIVEGERPMRTEIALPT